MKKPKEISAFCWIMDSAFWLKSELFLSIRNNLVKLFLFVKLDFSLSFDEQTANKSDLILLRQRLRLRL